MAKRTLVKNYLAQWMQMGKSISIAGQNENIHIYKVVQGERYSPLFNKLWDAVSSNQANAAYLSGTEQTIGELLSDKWDIIACARCNLLTPCIDVGPRVPVCCPCDDLPNHPNLDLVMPHVPVVLADYLDEVCDRIAILNQNHQDLTAQAPEDTTETYTTQEEDNQAIRNLRNSILKLVRTAPTNE
ncbi:MAG: hypothetical protein NW214_15790 [Pseudanabaenaceae cyanobacterium bins.39]|nr:hypothetical protein [Pseudanabaenaceae cyanobacterium bins.39]